MTIILHLFRKYITKVTEKVTYTNTQEKNIESILKFIHENKKKVTFIFFQVTCMRTNQLFSPNFMPWDNTYLNFNHRQINELETICLDSSNNIFEFRTKLVLKNAKVYSIRASSDVSSP